MRPCVNGDLVATHVFLLQECGVGDDTRTDRKESSLEVVLVKIVEQVGSVKGGTVVVGQTPRVLVGACRDISITDATTASPPTTALVLGKLRVGGATTGLSRLEVGDSDARVLDVLDPLLDFGRVSRWGLVERGVVGGRERLP